MDGELGSLSGRYRPYMRYLVSIFLCALAIGAFFSFVVYLVFGNDAAQFVAKFVSGPLGLAGAVLLFLIYDAVFPKSRNSSRQGVGREDRDPK